MAHPAYRELIESLQAQNAFLRREVEHQAAIIVGLTRRLPIPALPPAADEGHGGEPMPLQHLTWWRRRWGRRG